MVPPPQSDGTNNTVARKNATVESSNADLQGANKIIEQSGLVLGP